MSSQNPVSVFDRLQKDPFQLQRIAHTKIYDRPWSAHEPPPSGFKMFDEPQQPGLRLVTSAEQLPENATFSSAFLETCGIDPTQHKPKVLPLKRWNNSGALPVQEPGSLPMRPNFKRVMDYANFQQDGVRAKLGFGKIPITQFGRPTYKSFRTPETYRPIQQEEMAHNRNAHLFYEDRY